MSTHTYNYMAKKVNTHQKGDKERKPFTSCWQNMVKYLSPANVISSCRVNILCVWSYIFATSDSKKGTKFGKQNNFKIDSLYQTKLWSKIFFLLSQVQLELWLQNLQNATKSECQNKDHYNNLTLKWFQQ